MRVGVSTGHPDITAGTIGARVTDGINVYALSNNHVYADGNAASIGDGAIQPGTVDGGTDPADRIGTLHDFEPIDFTGGDNLMDAAIVISSIDLLGNSTPCRRWLWNSKLNPDISFCRNECAEVWPYHRADRGRD